MDQTANHDNLSPELFRLLGYLKQDPGNEPLTFDLIDRCIAQNQLQLAQQVLSDAQQRWPDAIGVLNRKAIIALRSNDPAGAIVELDKIVAANKADSAIRYNLAYAHYLIGDYARVRFVLEPALNDPTHAALINPLYLLSLQQLNEIDAATVFAEQLLQTNPDDAELQGVVALLYLDAEREPDLCRKFVANALRHNPAHPMALIAASTLALMDEDSRSALELAHRVVARNPADGRAWSSIGLAHMFARDMAQAESALQRAVQHMPNHIGIWHALAWTQLFQNDVDGAEASYQRAADLDRSWGETQAGLAVVAYLRNDHAKAKRLIERAKRLAPEGLTALYLKYLQIRDAGDQIKLQAYLDDALRRTPSFQGDSLLDVVRRIRRV